MVQLSVYMAYLSIALLALAFGLFALLLPRWCARLSIFRIGYLLIMALRRRPAAPLTPSRIRGTRWTGVFYIFLACIWLASLHPQFRLLPQPLYDPDTHKWQAEKADGSPQEVQDLERLDATTRAALKPVRIGLCAGMCVGVVRGDKTYVLRVGRKDMRDSEPPDADTLFEIGSITKTFTSAALASLVEDGSVHLDDPLGALLPDWSIPERDGCKITLNDLATHRSGLPRMPGKPTLTSLFDAILFRGLVNPYRKGSAGSVKRYLANFTLPRTPGVEDEYSNLGAGILGYALGQKTGLSYADLIKQRIFDPIDMHDSFVSTLNPHQGPFCQGYVGPIRLGRLHLVFPMRRWQFADGFQGGGSIVSTVHDMLKYLRANINAPEGPLGKTLARVQEPQYKVKDVKDCRIGLALMSMKIDGLDDVMYWHNGGTGGYNSFMGFSKSDNVGVVMLTSGPCKERLGIEILKSLAK